MREIKFRAWDDNKTGAYNSIVYQNDQELWEYFRNLNDDERKYDCKFVFMQFTGLQDKNGKEDYHKNILRDILTRLLCTVEYGKYKGRNGTGFGWYLQKMNGEFYVPYPYELSGWEVIGNIYENPELLEATK